VADRWRPAELLGLWVRFADWGVPAAAEFTCRHGCHYEAHGAAEVTHLTRTIAETHARECPGAPPPDVRPARGRS
jgi:hypothetical protein